MIFVNFKTYKETTGEKAIKLQEAINHVSKETKVPIISCPQAIDLRAIKTSATSPVWAQHVDFYDRGRATGWFLPEIAKEAGAKGVLLNHSEHRLPFGILNDTVKRCRAIGLKMLIFAALPSEAVSIVELKPDFIGYEPPELVGSTTISVATAHPDVIKEVANITEKARIPLIVGAGVHTLMDVETSLRLGAVGIAVATDVDKAKNPEKALRKLAEGFKGNI